MASLRRETLQKQQSPDIFRALLLQAKN